MDGKSVSWVAIGLTFVMSGFVFYALCVAVSNAVFEVSTQKCRWLKRKLNFLDAISTDIEEVTKSVEQIRKGASQLGGPEPNNLEGITKALRAIDVQNWERKANYVLTSASPVVKRFEALSENRSQLTRYLATLWDLIPMIDNALEMKKAAKEVEEYCEKQKEPTGELCELLEQTREQVWSLQDRPIARTVNEFQGRRRVPFNPAMGLAQERLAGLGQNLIRGKLAGDLREAVIKVNLVQALVKDLRWVKLESALEKAWKKEAEDVIEYARAMEVLEYAEADERLVRWPVALGLRNWMAKRMIKERIAYFDSQYSDLLEAKARYRIKFLRKDTKRHVRRRLHRAAAVGGRDVPAVIAGIRRELRGRTFVAGSDLHRRVSQLCKELGSLEQFLKEESAEEGAINARKACFELLKNMVLEVEICVRDRGNTWETSEIERLHKAVTLLRETVKDCSVKVMNDACSAVGFDEDVHELVSTLVALSDEGVERNDPMVVSIVGTQGIGKTTLAKEVMNHSSIITHFAKSCMLKFSELGSVSTEKQLLARIAHKMQLPGTRDDDEANNWFDEMRSFLMNQPCLVVLDDLPSSESWDTLKHAFPGRSRTVLLVTTGSKEVSRHANPSEDPRRTHRMRLRTDEESLELFMQMVKFPLDTDAKTKLAKKGVGKTGGLPLAIMHLGYLLFGKDLDEKELTKVFDRDHIAQEQWSKTWEINKEDFQSRPNLGKCFSYSEFFPDDFEIPRRRLLALWVASGSVQSDKAAAEHLQELVDRNMIQVVKRKGNGDINTCRFPRTLKEIWVGDTRNKESRAWSWSLFANFNRQLAYRYNDQLDSGAARSVHGLNSNVVLPEERYPRSIMFFDTRDGNKPNEDIGNFLLKGIASNHKHFQELLVLDLENVFRPHLPRSIGKLKKLTYLCLRWTYLEILPESIGKLPQLQTLDLKHTYVKTLPPSIWKLKALRHLYLSEHCRIKHMPTLTSHSMRNLQTLSDVFLDHEGSALSIGLDKLQSLRKLGVTVSQLSSGQQELLGNGIAQLTNLRSLSLRSINEIGDPHSLNLTSLSGLSNLTKLYLLGKLENTSVLSNLPQSLTELTLSASRISFDPVPMLAILRRLKFLSFLAEAYVGTRMDFHENHFPELLVLQIWCLPNLTDLEIRLEAMPKLREFEIRYCQMLSTANGLTNLKTLQELKLTNMTHLEPVIENEFAAARENSSERVVHCPSITRKTRNLLEREV